MAKYLSLILCLFGSIVFAQNSLVSEVIIEGNKRTRTSFLNRLALVKEGQALDTLRINDDVRRLKLLPGLANVTSKVKQNGNLTQVVYTVEENFAIIPGLNISTAPNGDFAYRVSLFDFNFLGRNQIIGGYYAKNVFDSYGIFWEAPNLFTRKLGIGTNYQNNVTFEPVYFKNQQEANYKLDRKSFEIKLQYEHNFNNRFELGFNYTMENYNFQDGNIPFGIPLNLEGTRLSVIGEYEYNNINIDYQYQTGFRSILTYSINVNSKGDNQFLQNNIIARNDFEYFKRIGNNGNFANRLRLAYATNDTTPFAPFSIDNQLNIRGAGNIVDRGNASVVLNTEYRQTLYEKAWFVIQGNAFLDAGSWREPNTDFSNLLEGSFARISTGLGLRFIHKRIFNAVFRLDYGVGLGSNAANGLVFGIGQYF